MIKADQPTIFNDLPITATVSSDDEGQMGIRLGNEAEVIANIKSHTNDHPVALIKCTYGRDNYDIILNVDEDTTLFNDDPNDRLEYDALITSFTGVKLALPVADCLALVLYDPINNVTALAHLGRHATLDLLAAKLVQHMSEHYGSQPEYILAFFSPSIKKSNYAMDFWDHQDNTDWSDYWEKIDGRYHIDIPGFNQNQLLRAGLKKDNIEISPINTATSENYGSHYQNARNPDKSDNRFLVTALLTEAS